MAETARRMAHGHGSDVVRRLIARPIRSQSARVATPTAVVPSRADEAVSTTAESAKPTPIESSSAHGFEAPSAIAAPLPNTERLRTEMLLLKAVLQAERRENDSLRACLGFDEADAGLNSEARAMRDRWAALVDRLLHAPA